MSFPPPGNTLTNPAAPTIGVGCGAGGLETFPFPAEPKRFVPQQYVVPAAMPHDVTDPSFMSLKDSPPTIGVGVVTAGAALPIPSCCMLFAPQQYALPDDVIPQLAHSADVRRANDGAPITGTGASERVVEVTPLPSCP
jgi:hypothetical protein